MDQPRPNQTLRRARAEAMIIMAAYVIAMTWTGVVCYVWGYDHERTITRPFGLGMPDWIFWGIVVPWIACNLFTAWFTLFYMEDEVMADEDAAEPTSEEGHGR